MANNTLRQMDHNCFVGRKHFARWTRLTDNEVDYGFRVSDMQGNVQNFRLPIDKVAKALGYDAVELFVDRAEYADSFEHRR